MTTPPLRHPQLAVACPWCKAAAGDPCTGVRGVRSRNRVRRGRTHTARRSAWAVAMACCPACQVEPGTPCRTPNGWALEEPHPERDAEAVRTAPPARRPRIECLGEQQHIEITDTKES